MVSINKSVSDSGMFDESIVLQEIKKVANTIVFSFNKSCFNAWLENTNKHIPEVYELNKSATGEFSLSVSRLPVSLVNTSLKLTISNSINRLDYILKEKKFRFTKIGNLEFYIERRKDVVINIKSKSRITDSKMMSYQSSCYTKSNLNNQFEKAKNKSTPVKIGVIGSCFSRSVFRSDPFFNPEYKKYFTIPLTFFHNSLISIMSKSFEDKEYLLASDLQYNLARRYTEIEFLKNVKEQICSSEIEYIVLDNYSDAVLEVIEMNEESFLTYNKYFSESIYKRKFSNKPILFPGEISHLEKYRKALKKFYCLLQELQLDKKVILLGGRLSIFKTQSELWASKMDWIINSNFKWDLYDSIFLEEIPDAQYIDMKTTSWISDVNTPIIGGASPSHYQSGFYKEIYKKILNIIY